MLIMIETADVQEAIVEDNANKKTTEPLEGDNSSNDTIPYTPEDQPTVAASYANADGNRPSTASLTEKFPTSRPTA